MNDSKRDELAKTYAQREFASWKQKVIESKNPTIQTRDAETCFKAGYDAGRASRDEEIAKLVEALEEIAHTPIDLAQYSVKDAQWTAREAVKLYREDE